MKVRITLERGNTSVEAEINEMGSPIVAKSLLKLLPIKSTVSHARWGGNEIWTSLKGFEKYANENATCLPVPGEICVVPVGGDNFDLAIWYGRGWLFGPESGFLPAAVVGKITNGLSEFAVAANEVLTKGNDTIIVEKV